MLVADISEAEEDKMHMTKDDCSGDDGKSSPVWRQAWLQRKNHRRFQLNHFCAVPVVEEKQSTDLQRVISQEIRLKGLVHADPIEKNGRRDKLTVFGE